MQKSKIPYYLTIDFEDFHHDYSRLLGIPKPEFREKSLIESYKVIKNLISNIPKSGKENIATFFVTGVVAKKFPEIIKIIKNDGNEIACHYFFHDNINTQSREAFKKNLDLAIEAIAKATGEIPKGFRAPNFAISRNSLWAFEEISKRFLYDSSFKVDLKDEKDIKFYKEYFKNLKLYQFFIFQLNLIENILPVRLGGTFIKVLPNKFFSDGLEKIFYKNYTPILYLHPYEVLEKKYFSIPFKELKKLNINKFFMWLRQNQWILLSGKRYINKIHSITNIFEHQGLLSNNKNFLKFCE